MIEASIKRIRLFFRWSLVIYLGAWCTTHRIKNQDYKVKLILTFDLFYNIRNITVVPFRIITRETKKYPIIKSIRLPLSHG